MSEDWKEGLKTLGKHGFVWHAPREAYKEVKKGGGTTGAALKSAGKSLLKHSTPLGWFEVARKTKEAWKKPKSNLSTEDVMSTMYEADDQGANMIECPHCYEEFLLEDVDLYEDNEGQFTICPFCEEDIDLVEGEEEEKEYTMNEQIFESLLENVSQLNEEDVDGFVDNLTEDEVDQMLEFCDILEEMEAEEDMDAGDLAEGLIDTILEGTDPAEIADLLAGRTE